MSAPFETVPPNEDDNKILVINPNSTTSMTDSLEALLLGDEISRKYPNTAYAFFTNPIGPPSINNDADAFESTAHCIRALSVPGYLDQFDGILVACYSDHPLVGWLKDRDIGKTPKICVTGIFEASIWQSLPLCRWWYMEYGVEGSFGIVSTGKVWEESLTNAARKYFKGYWPEQRFKFRFAGVETTGLNATDLHDAPAEEVRKKMKEATKRLARKPGLAAVCLGCAGMVGMDVMVREALVEVLGPYQGNTVKIVDGVKAGIAQILAGELLELKIKP